MDIDRCRRCFAKITAMMVWRHFYPIWLAGDRLFHLANSLDKLDETQPRAFSFLGSLFDDIGSLVMSMILARHRRASSCFFFVLWLVAADGQFRIITACVRLLLVGHFLAFSPRFLCPSVLSVSRFLVLLVDSVAQFDHCTFISRGICPVRVFGCSPLRCIDNAWSPNLLSNIVGASGGSLCPPVAHPGSRWWLGISRLG